MQIRRRLFLDRDIEALVEEKVSEVPEIFDLDSFQISSGNKLIATSTVSLKRDGKLITEAATGDGPVDAAFNAMERAVGFNLGIRRLWINAVTEGKDALGEATVRFQRTASFLWAEV